MSSLPPVQQNAVNQYVLLDPAVQAEDYEWWQTACNVAWWVTLIGYTLLAVGVTVVVGITSPANLPIATIAATFAMYPASNFAAQFTSQALAYGHLARIERRIEDIAAGFRPNQNGNIVDPQIDDIVVPPEHRSLAARYVYWKGAAESLIEGSREISQRPLWLPRERREDALSQEERQQLEQRYQANVAQMPAITRELFEREALLNNRTIAFHLQEEALRAKVYAAFCHGVLVRPDFPIELENRVHFFLPAIGATDDEKTRKTQMRIGSRGLSREFNAPRDDLLIMINRSEALREEAPAALSFDEVSDMTEDELATMLVPAAE